ncbi:hypothetical protein OUZ56_005192 [Daphnia magna]|uniref:Uncharacterized protein n=1 Tax=Daphnia magna TaxID=35525 RepID=A0ABQ9YS35_9CRUS|nr:hypothetical protein OUZ56_005192 [Daphnia magna]
MEEKYRENRNVFCPLDDSRIAGRAVTTAVDVERTVLVKKVPGQQNKKTTLLSMAKCEPCLMDGYGSAAASLTPPMP